VAWLLERAAREKWHAHKGVTERPQRERQSCRVEQGRIDSVIAVLFLSPSAVGRRQGWALQSHIRRPGVWGRDGSRKRRGRSALFATCHSVASGAERGCGGLGAAEQY
jgi:hypothetical protein